LNKFGTLVATLTSKTFLDGPWAFSAYEENNGATVALFVSNALSGTVDRLTLSVPASGNDVKMTGAVQIGSGFIHGPNAAAFVIGPAGSAYDPANGDLYVNGEGENAVYAIPNALTTTTDHGKGALVFQDNTDLHGPYGLILTAGGDLIIANADSVNSDPNHPSELVEITTSGHLIATHSIDPTTGGAFEIAESFTLGVHRFAYVDDVTNDLTIWTLPD
jgi:DNA-binding beta-propeller fold protein YncE